MPRTSAQGRSTLPPSGGTERATTSVEDYAKTIYGLSEWEGADVTASAVAKNLGVSNPSVTLMIRKMDELGLVEYQPYAPVRLTEAGRRLALAMVRRHRLIETWLVRELGYGWDEVHDEAERLEHAVSETFIERLDAKLSHPTTDPHGDPIPAADLSLQYPETTLLCRVPEESTVRVEQVDDSVPEALHALAERRIAIGAEMRVISSSSGDVVLDGGEDHNVDLNHQVAHAVRVSLAA
ncbi:metal-dependent transcriptional regulator [Nesterenkonia sp.]|uniref:metal-dependent transcriptional regulator n=1 Tax=Nesterenkonia sp. TaxID=704201 RepID=UPI00261C9AB4|nr:metal-dependent transcriptional regulator [Nesterenkonia sp.]